MEDPEALEKRANKEVELEAIRRTQGAADTTDIHGMKTPGEGRRILSWIWMAAASGATEDSRMHDGKLFYSTFNCFDTNLNYTAVRVEWSKALARTTRWMEEVGMLNEEMRRTLKSHAHKSEWWTLRRDGCGRVWVSADHAEGARAYADKQAAMYEALATYCREVWAKSKGRVTTRVAPQRDVPSGDGDLDSGDDSEEIVEIDDQV